MSGMSRAWLLRTATWLLLGAWVGSWGLFAFVIAPTAFQVLPSQAAAGRLVAPVLGKLHNFGVLAGLGLGGLALLERRAWPLVVAPLVLAALCAVSQYGITPAINAVEPHSFGALQEVEAARRFSELHQASRYVFGTVLAGVLALLCAQARPLRPPDT